ncbi:hypothetical protein HZ994_15975 [Akkermansiaceae bacterium]|nr:hypothetical protein HZ994_15975 [Akkermansiaceae bacterium]
MIEITFTSTVALSLTAELVLGTWAVTTIIANDDGLPINIQSFTPTMLDVNSAKTSHSFQATEDPGDPFLILHVTNTHHTDLDVAVPGQASFTIPPNNSVTITYPRSSNAHIRD